MLFAHDAQLTERKRYVSKHPPAARFEMTHWAYLYDADGSDRPVDIDEFTTDRIADHQLLWIDVKCVEQADVMDVTAKLPVTNDTVRRIFDANERKHLDNYTDYFAFAVEIPAQTANSPEASVSRDPAFLAFIVGDRWMLTIHNAEISYLKAFQAQDKGETKIGVLSPALLAASILDWHLAEFFRAAAKIEVDVDEIDEQILSEGADRKALTSIVAARRDASKLRKLISSQRPIFHGLTRPDFAVNADEHAASQFKALADRFDRAVDEVERTRDVVIGTFELFASMSSEETNDLVKALTFVTVVIGFSAAVAGLLGMNFEAPFYKTGMTGFVIASSIVVGLSVIAVIIAKLRHWI